MASRGLGEPQWDRKGKALAKAGKCRRLFSEEPCVPLLFVPNNTIEIQPICSLQDTKVLTCLKFAIYGDLAKDHFPLNTRITRPLSHLLSSTCGFATARGLPGRGAITPETPKLRQTGKSSQNAHA